MGATCKVYQLDALQRFTLASIVRSVLIISWVSRGYNRRWYLKLILNTSLRATSVEFVPKLFSGGRRQGERKAGCSGDLYRQRLRKDLTREQLLWV
jgi:hypothetical protein